MRKIKGINNFEIKLMPKLLKVINKHFPQEEERAAGDFEKEIKKFNKDIDDEQMLFFLFVQWFFLRYKMRNYLSIIDFLSTNPDMEFTPLEMEVLRNLQEHRRSLFRCKNISKDKKTLFLEDVLHKKESPVEVTLPKPLKKEISKEFILAVIVKKLDGKNYLFGPALGYTENEVPLVKKNFFG